MTQFEPETVGTIAMIHVESAETGVLIRVVGELDGMNGPQLRAMLGDATGASGHVHVDLTDCTYLDSSGISMLAQARRDRGDGLSVGIPPSGQVRRVIEICGLIAHFEATPKAGWAGAP